MATRKKQPAAQRPAQAAAAELPDPIQGETLEELQADALEDFLNQIEEEDAVVTLYRLNPGSGKRPAYLFSRGVAEVTMPEILEALRDDYGGGTFRLEVRNRKGYITAKYLEVEAPKRPLPGHEQRERDRERERERRDAAGAGALDLTPLLDLVERSNAQHREMLNTMVQALKPERRDMSELVESMAALDRLRPTPQAGGGMGVKDLLEAFQLFETIRGGGGDGGGTGSTGWDVLRSAVGSFFPMLQAGMMTAPQLPPGSPALTFQQPPAAEGPVYASGGAPADATPTTTTAAGGGNVPRGTYQAPGADRAELANHMQQQLELLLRAAGQDRDPYTYASLALDELGPESAQRLFLDPHGWAAFAGQVPAVTQQLASWFNDFRSELGAILQEETAGDVPPGNEGATPADNGHAARPSAGPGGDPPHAPDHGGPGQSGETGSADP